MGSRPPQANPISTWPSTEQSPAGKWPCEVGLVQKQEGPACPSTQGEERTTSSHSASSPTPQEGPPGLTTLQVPIGH